MFERRGMRRRPGAAGGAPTDIEHLQAFVASHRGVEAYLEPSPCPSVPTTVVLVAGSGEWTRRRVAGASGAREVARRCAVPLYDASLLGYPSRMRAWNGSRAAPGPEHLPGLGGGSAHRRPPAGGAAGSAGPPAGSR